LWTVKEKPCLIQQKIGNRGQKLTSCLFKGHLKEGLHVVAQGLNRGPLRLKTLDPKKTMMIHDYTGFRVIIPNMARTVEILKHHLQ